MKRRDLLRHLAKHGCAFLREGGNHTLYINRTAKKVSTIPRHNEINRDLARKICKDLQVPRPPDSRYGEAAAAAVVLEFSDPRSAAAFRGIGLARQAGTGIQAIFRHWKSLGHAPPVIRSDEVRNEFELTLLGRGTPAGERRPTLGTGAEPVEDRGDDDERLVDPPGADMVSDQDDQVRADMDSDQVALQLSARQRAIVAACDVPRSLAELMERAGVSHRSHFRRKHLKPLLEAGLVRMTNPGNPRAPNQRYVLTDAGAAVRGGG